MLKKLCIILLIALFLMSCAQKKEEAKPESQAKIETRDFPMPPFSELFSALDYLQKADFDKAVSNDIKKQNTDVFKAAYSLGALSADAILATKARNKTKLENIAKLMVESSKFIGVNEEVLKLADNLLQLVNQDKWDELQVSLDKYKQEIEVSLYQTKEYDLLTLIQMGGWTEGLNRTSFLIKANYVAQNTAILDQKGILDNLIKNIEKIENTEIKNQPYYANSLENYKKIGEIIQVQGKTTFTKEEVEKLLLLSGNIIKDFQ